MYQYKGFTIERVGDSMICSNGNYMITFIATDYSLYDKAQRKKSNIEEAKRRIDKFLFSQ